MAIHLSAGGDFAKKDIPEPVSSEQNPKNVKPKIRNQATEKNPEQNALSGAPVLSQSGADLLKKLEPLQPVIQKAIAENQALGKTLRDVGNLAEGDGSGNSGAGSKQKTRNQEVHPLPPAAPTPPDQLIHHDSRV